MQSSQTSEAEPLFWRRTKIIATLGPTSNTEKNIADLIDAGANVFRLNMSHGTHEEHRLLAQRIRKVSALKHTHIAILMDLCGPKIRVGEFKGGEAVLEQGAEVVVRCSKILGDSKIIPSQYINLYKDVKKNERILLDDGKIELKVKSIKDKNVICVVVYGGILKNKKGLNLPDSSMSINSFTLKDKKDTQLAVELNADFIALSFVRDEKCIITLKKHIKKLSSDIPVIAKIEKPEAIKNIEKILTHADGIMVARGDLGIEMLAQQVPLIQKDLINKARLFGKPVIVATQMLESMIVSSKPTRAEVGDVATAALSSTDAVMLSAETASGKYPILAVEMMDQILREMENYQWEHKKFGEYEFDQLEIAGEPDRKIFSRAVKSLAQELHLQGIVVPTRSGSTARALSADRPHAPLISISSHAEVCRRLALSWGVVPMCIKYKKTRDWQSLCNEVAKKYELARTGNRVLLVAGFNDDVELSEPILKLMHIESGKTS